ncbi:MAG TPA: hypothetical protein VNJ01_02725 [Bacteriovoracaceae bacterium]|nr:hypothetical protein [Bacteriovoracaceae bacterium]
MRSLLVVTYWCLYFPLLKLLVFCLLGNKKVKQRLSFEQKNHAQAQCQSFKSEGAQADLCFEFSSEGEFQQIAGLVSDALGAGKKLELIFFSPSVEKAIVELAGLYPRQIRYLRFPLLSANNKVHFSKWVSARKLVMVRYDFFPELLLWALRPGHQLIFLWVSLKRERLKGVAPGWYKLMFLRASQQLYFSTSEDLNYAKLLGLTGEVHDFRIEQIRRRLVHRLENFQRLLPEYPQLKSIMEKYPREKRLLFGNAWPSDLFLLKLLPEDVFILVVPHQLTPEILQAFRTSLDRIRGKTVVLDDHTTTIVDSSTYLLNKKGVLCELYSDFGKAYVGGGFQTSIHSVLEPLVSGSDGIACGPSNHRSSEYDLAAGMGMMTEVNGPEEFLGWLQTHHASRTGIDKLEEVFNRYPQFRDKIVSC